jgi:hypothetical protein
MILPSLKHIASSPYLFNDMPLPFMGQGRSPFVSLVPDEHLIPECSNQPHLALLPFGGFDLKEPSPKKPE